MIWLYFLAFKISGIIQLDQVLIYGYNKSRMYGLPVFLIFVIRINKVNISLKITL